MTCTKCRHTETKKCGFSGKRKLQRYHCQSCNSTFIDPTAEKPLGTHYIDLETTARVLELMMEGTSVRAISRLTSLHVETILSLMLTAGEKCQRLLDTRIRGLKPNLVQATSYTSPSAVTQNACDSMLPKNGVARGRGLRSTANQS
jgi:transposase-like protein